MIDGTPTPRAQRLEPHSKLSTAEAPRVRGAAAGTTSSRRRRLRLGVALLVALAATSAAAQGSFVNFESPPVHPVDMTPDGSTLLAVNTADDRLEVFTLSNGLP